MKLIWRMILALSMSFMVGAQKPPSPIGPKLAVELSARVREGDEIWERCYRDPEKIDAVLYYLRSLDPHMPAQEDPERYRVDRCCIILTMVDGRQVRYYQRGENWLSRNGKPWMCIRKDRGQLLLPLLRALASDTEN